MKMNNIEEILLEKFKYLSQIKTIEEYFLYLKTSRLNSLFRKEKYNDLFGNDNIHDVINEIKNRYFFKFSDDPVKDIEKLDVDFEIIKHDSFFEKIVNITTSADFFVDIPGKSLNFLFKDKNTKKYLGFLTMSNSVVMMKPRNIVLGKNLPITEVNKHILYGRLIVPTQPFGYNALGGKMLALLMLSNKIRNILNSYFDMEIHFFETTSLYGSIKQTSQYDGLEPYLKRGVTLTDSKIPMYLNKEDSSLILMFLKKYPDLKVENKGNPTSPKLKQYLKILRKLKELYPTADFLKNLNVRTRKTYYYCFVYKDSKDLLNGTISHSKKELRLNFDYEYLLDRWKKKAIKRVKKLIENNKFIYNM